MEIQEAIEILSHLKGATNSASRQECEKAYQLGIEAMEYVEHLRQLGMPGIISQLPGETED